MNLPQRIFWGSFAVCAWLFVVTPSLSDAIHRSTLEGPEPFSVSTVRSILFENGDTGAPDIDPDLKEMLSELAALELAENERVTALWSLVDIDTRTLALEKIGAVPPLTYAVDPRFFDPLTPSIVQRTIEAYGFTLEPLPRSTLTQRGEAGDQREQLMTVLSLIHHDLLSQEQAAMTLQGAMDLLDLQMKRKTLEERLRSQLEDQL